MKKLLLAILSALCLLSCSRVEEAKKVVEVAEAMRLGEGKIYSDSTKLAETVNALKPFRWIYPTDYARANYYYGKLLRKNKNETDAMRCFIETLHSHTTDHSILGRTYSNIGEICDYIKKYDMGYDIFLKACECFKKAKDSTLYYGAIYNLSLETAASCQKEKTLFYTRIIEQNCKDSSIINLAYLSKATMYYFCCKQYDSTIYYAEKFLQQFPNDANGYILKAQAFSGLGEKDSAVYYAEIVYKTTDSAKKKYNALYILSHDDTSLNKDDVLKLTSDREDVHRHELDPQYIDKAKAIQLLEQDLNRKPNYPLIIIIAAALTAFIVVTAITAKRIRKKQKRLKHEQLSVEERQKKLERDAAIYERQRNEHLNKLKTHLEETCRAIRETQDLKKTMKWELFDEMCAVADLRLMNIATRLKSFGLNEREVRLCVLVMIDGFSGKEIAQNINYAESGIRSLKSKTAKKIGTDSKNLRKTLQNIAIIPD